MTPSIKEALARRVRAHTDTGFYYLRYKGPGFFTDKMINPSKLARHHFALSGIAADRIHDMTSSGLVGQIDDGDIHWTQELNRRLKERGVELPMAEIDKDGKHIWGTPFEKFPHTAVTVLVSVNTLGQQIARMRSLLEKQDMRVRNALVLIERNPDPASFIDGIPISSVLNVPLPLYTESTDMEGFAKLLKKRGESAYDDVQELLS